MKPFLLSWQFWALMSAAFAALTAIFAKSPTLTEQVYFCFRKVVVAIGVAQDAWTNSMSGARGSVRRTLSDRNSATAPPSWSA
jgi:uncharacterized membrane protein